MIVHWRGDDRQAVLLEVTHSHENVLYAVSERENTHLFILKRLQGGGEAAQQWDSLWTEDANRWWAVDVIKKCLTDIPQEVFIPLIPTFRTCMHSDNMHLNLSQRRNGCLIITLRCNCVY